jgi:hypothetical protein
MTSVNIDRQKRSTRQELTVQTQPKHYHQLPFTNHHNLHYPCKLFTDAAHRMKRLHKKELENEDEVAVWFNKSRNNKESSQDIKCAGYLLTKVRSVVGPTTWWRRRWINCPLYTDRSQPMCYDTLNSNSVVNIWQLSTVCASRNGTGSMLLFLA